jgi:hypothetical protein
MTRVSSINAFESVPGNKVHGNIIKKSRSLIQHTLAQISKLQTLKFSSSFTSTYPQINTNISSPSTFLPVIEQQSISMPALAYLITHWQCCEGTKPLYNINMRTANGQGTLRKLPVNNPRSSRF